MMVKMIESWPTPPNEHHRHHHGVIDDNDNDGEGDVTADTHQ